jgi:hypothetical protein
MPLRVGWHLVVRVFPLGISRERRLKPPNPYLIEGLLAPVWYYGEVFTLAGSHPRMVTQAPLRS